MSRNLGPRLRIARALGTNLPGLTRKTIERRPYPPGQHGLNRRKKSSPYKLRLVEKQKLRFNYGLTERQLRNLIDLAGRKAADPTEMLIELLERRLDNVLFRAGFARTISAARQLINHGHITVNGKRVDIASFQVKNGLSVSLRERSRNLDIIAMSLLEPVAPLPPWLNVDKEHLIVTVTTAPDSSSLLFNVDLRLIVEYYSQRG